MSIIFQQILTSMQHPRQWNIIPHPAVTGLGPMTCFGISHISRQRPSKGLRSWTWLFCALVICHEKSLLSSCCAFDLGPRIDKYRADVTSACNLQTQMTYSFPAKPSQDQLGYSWHAELSTRTDTFCEALYLWGYFVLFCFICFMEHIRSNSWLLCYLKSSSHC